MALHSGFFLAFHENSRCFSRMPFWGGCVRHAFGSCTKLTSAVQKKSPFLPKGCVWSSGQLQNSHTKTFKRSIVEHSNTDEKSEFLSASLPYSGQRLHTLRKTTNSSGASFVLPEKKEVRNTHMFFPHV